MGQQKSVAEKKERVGGFVFDTSELFKIVGELTEQSLGWLPGRL